MTAAEAREKALAAIAEARADRETGPLFADFVADFMRRQGQRWKPSTRAGNAHLIDRYLVPFFGAMPAAWKIAPRDTFIGWTPEQRQKNLPRNCSPPGSGMMSG